MLYISESLKPALVMLKDQLGSQEELKGLGILDLMPIGTTWL